MKLNRRQLGAIALRLLSVTAAAAAACALWGGAASAATASVAKHATKTTISISPAKAYSTSWVTFSARVRSAGGGRAQGTVSFQWRNEKLCTRRLVAGKTHCLIRVVGIGKFAIRAHYSGNATHLASVSGRDFLTIRRAPTVTKITNAAGGTITTGGAYTFHVTVSAPAGVVRPIGTVVVQPSASADLPFAEYGCETTVINGKGSCTVHPPAYGVVGYTATFQGNPIWKGSTYAGPYDLAVQNDTSTTVTATSATAGDITLTATVVANGADIAEDNGGSGTVSFSVNGTPVTGCTELPLANPTKGGDNVATCTANATLNGLTASTTYDVTAVFSGDPTNVGSTSPDYELTPTP
jgi:Bacterial Ig-like domain (group 3)